LAASPLPKNGVGDEAATEPPPPFPPAQNEPLLVDTIRNVETRLDILLNNAGIEHKLVLAEINKENR
jgi:hypothetical protein